ncbi:MAG: host attachment protein [Alphaproteobacteria bacterium]|nr:host attachment protein [Alphaproteobacteria bacterium]
MLLPHGAFVAVVDGQKLELYRNSGSESAPELAPMTAPKLDEHNKESGSRHFSSAANPSRRQLDEDSHAAAVAVWLNEQVLGQKIERLVVVAAPRALGELRRRYSKQLDAALIGELDKELIGRSAEEVLAALQGK